MKINIWSITLYNTILLYNIISPTLNKLLNITILLLLYYSYYNKYNKLNITIKFRHNNPARYRIIRPDTGSEGIRSIYSMGGIFK